MIAIEQSKSVKFSRFITLISLTLVIIIAWKIIELFWVRPRKIERLFRKQGLKGTPYKPFVGDGLELMRLNKEQPSMPFIADDPLPGITAFFHQSIQKNGKISYAWISSIPCILITVPELIKEILQKYEQFKKPNHPFNKSLMVGLIGHEGDEWAKHRKIISPAFNINTLKNIFEVTYLSCSEMMKAWEDIGLKEGAIELDVWPFLERLTADVISRAAFGSSYQQGRRIFDLLKEHADLLMKSQESNYIPGWRLLPTKTNKRVNNICKEVNAILTEMIDSRKRELVVGASSRNDLLDKLLEANLNEIRENGKGLTTKDVVEECKLFYFAGQETTSSLLGWTVVLLSKHQIWQERARKEVMTAFAKDNKLDYDGLNQLKVVTMILNEVLRLYSPIYAIMRKVYKDTYLGNTAMLFPKGTEFLIPTSIFHRDHEIWGEDANNFNPERFSYGVSRATKGIVGSFLPFGTGPRVCIGQNFSFLEAKLALTMILRVYRFEISEAYVHAPFAGLTLKPQYGIKLVLHKI